MAFGLIIFLIFLILMVVFFIFGMRYITRERRIAWSGELIDKYQFEREETIGEHDSGRTYDVYMLKVKLDNGKTHELPVSKEFYDEIKIGDKLKKDLGTSRPTKI